MYQPGRFYGRWQSPLRGSKRAPRAALMSGATSIGVTVDEYIAHLENGEAWCGYHRLWELKAGFPPDPKRITGVRNICRAGEAERQRARKAAKTASSESVPVGGI